MNAPKVPSYLSEVNPAEWAFILLQRTRAAHTATVWVIYDDSDLFA